VLDAIVQKFGLVMVSQSLQLPSDCRVDVIVDLALMKIQTVLPDRGAREKRRATVLVEFGKERMTIEVVVPADRDENGVRELAVARAKDFARRFVLNERTGN
jgi:hypothetical protein